MQINLLHLKSRSKFAPGCKLAPGCKCLKHRSHGANLHPGANCAYELSFRGRKKNLQNSEMKLPWDLCYRQKCEKHVTHYRLRIVYRDVKPQSKQNKNILRDRDWGGAAVVLSTGFPCSVAGICWTKSPCYFRGGADHK